MRDIVEQLQECLDTAALAQVTGKFPVRQEVLSEAKAEIERLRAIDEQTADVLQGLDEQLRAKDAEIVHIAIEVEKFRTKVLAIDMVWFEALERQQNEIESLHRSISAMTDVAAGYQTTAHRLEDEAEKLRAEVEHWKQELTDTLDNEGFEVPEALKGYVRG